MPLHTCVTLRYCRSSAQTKLCRQETPNCVCVCVRKMSADPGQQQGGARQGREVVNFFTAISFSHHSRRNSRCSSSCSCSRSSSSSSSSFLPAAAAAAAANFLQKCSVSRVSEATLESFLVGFLDQFVLQGYGVSPSRRAVSL